MTKKSGSDGDLVDLPDIRLNRQLQSWSNRELFFRLLWEAVGGPIFWLLPRPLWGTRVAVLKVFGAKIGKDVRIHQSTSIKVPWNLIIDDHVGIGEGVVLYSLGQIHIGANATISQRAHLCAGTHDYSDASMPLIKANITVGPGAWVCADAFVGPGVTVGQLAILGARAVATKNVSENAIFAGNPASKIGQRRLKK